MTVPMVLQTMNLSRYPLPRVLPPSAGEHQQVLADDEEWLSGMQHTYIAF